MELIWEDVYLPSVNIIHSTNENRRMLNQEWY